MKRIITTLYISLLAATVVTAQSDDFSYKVKRNQGIQLYKVVNFKSNTVLWNAQLNSVEYEAPMPDMIETGAKAKINQMRNEHNAARAKRGYDSDATSKEVNPNSNRGFQGAIPVSTPNDNHCAVSKNGTVISVINQVIRATDSDGNILMNSTLQDFPQDSLGNLTRSFDPKVIYDEDEDKFIFVFLEGNGSLSSKILVAFTETNDPAGNWFVYAVPGNPLDDKSWSDYPIIGTSGEDFYLTLNLLKNGGSWQEGFKQSIIWQINKKSGFTGQKELATNLFYDIKYKEKSVWSICPVQGGLKPSSPGMYFLSVRPGDFQNDTVFLHTIDNTQASDKAKISLRVLTTDKMYGVPPSAQQPAAGYKLQTNDCRVLSAIFHDNTIQYVQTTSDLNTMTSGIYHGIIRNVIWPSVTYVKGHIISSDSVDYGYPSIAYAGVGDDHQSAMMTFSHVSSTTYAGTSVLYYDGLGLYSEVVRVRDGDGLVDVPFLADSIERWGDYTQIQRKYDEPGVFWLSGSFGASDNKPATWVAEIKNGDTRTFSVSTKTYNPVVGKMLVYPNPVSNTFTTEITLTEDYSDVSFELYDMNGKRIATLLTKPSLEQGKHTFSFNTASLADGTYLLSIKAGGKELQTERIVVVR